MKRFISSALLLFAATAQAQSIPAQCVVSYPQNASGQYQLHTQVGVASSFKESLNWATAVAFQVPAGPITRASLTFPTLATGGGVAGTTTAYLTLIPATNADLTCAGAGPGFVLSVKPKKDSSLVVLASSVVTPLQTGDVTFVLNAKALNMLRGMAGTSAVFGVSMLVPRITVTPPGEDPKKINQVGALINLWRQSACNGAPSPYCPSLNLN